MKKHLETESTLPTTEHSQSIRWGLSACIDLYDCSPEAIRSEIGIRTYVSELIALIDMKAYGPCHITHFGEDERVAGYSMFQFIETSCISGHFANQTNHAYLDIFSCKDFDVDIATAFGQKWFGAQSVRIQAHDRL